MTKKIQSQSKRWKKRILPSDEFVARILTDKEKGLTAKQIQSFHGITPNQYKYIVYTLGKKLDKSPNFKSTKSARSVNVNVLSAAGAKAEVWVPMEKTVDYFYGEKEKKNFWKGLVSKIFFWYGQKSKG